MEPGDVIGGRYRLVEPLASGGMGTVWRARHVELDVDVAVKLMSDALSRTATALARFQREAKAAAQLKSPHVVQVFDYGVEHARPYLAMELLEGEDLRTHLERVGAMPLDRIAKVLDALAKALRVAHGAGIVHRDLKPANVFLQRSGDDEVVKILDFGIAKDLTPVMDGLRTSTSTVVGSPLYMSPEQVRGAEVDHRTDVWSLAVIAFEMATGRQPFEGASLGDVFARIIADDIPRATSVAPWLPGSIDTFFERALARPVAKRFATALELSESFRAAVADTISQDLPIHRPPATPRASPDAPTIEAVDGLARPLAGSEAFAPAHTAGPPREAPDSIHYARTVATPAPAVRSAPTDEPKRGGGRAAAIALASVAAVATLTAVGVSLRSPTDEPAAPAIAESSKAAISASPPEPSERAPSPNVEPSSSAVPAEPLPPPSASASAAPSAPPSARPPTSWGVPKPAGSPAAPGQTSAPKSTTAIDPIFGVPVKKP